jgi:transglutaminase-like putative cysteine protease
MDPQGGWTTSPRAQQEVIVSDPDRNRFDRLHVSTGHELTINFEAEVEVQRFARQKFAKHRDAHSIEIMQWIHDNVEYVPGTTTSARSAGGE